MFTDMQHGDAPKPNAKTEGPLHTKWVANKQHEKAKCWDVKQSQLVTGTNERQSFDRKAVGSAVSSYRGRNCTGLVWNINIQIVGV